MEMTNYCVIAGVSILFLVGCLAHLSENDIFSMERIQKFQRLIYIMIFEILIDCVFELLEGSEIAGIMLYLIKSVELIINPFLAFLVFDIFYDKKMNQRNETMLKIRKIMLSIVVANGILQAAAVLGWQVFYIDENNLYHRGPLVLVYVAFLLLAVFALLCGMLVFSSKTQSTMRFTLFSFAAILVLGIFLRNIFPKNNYDFLCLSVSVSFLLIYYAHVTLRVDPLTKLLNRQVYSRIIKKINYKTIIIMIDVNNFKQVNDSYGHECGDQTLRQLARVICKAHGKYAYCFRIGGDEFCVILKPGIFDKMIEEVSHHDTYSMAENLMRKLDELIAKINDDDSYLESGVSQGYGVFYPPANYPGNSEKIPIEKVIELADQRMYRSKEAYQNQNKPAQ